MAQTVGELLTDTLARIHATQVFGVVGDALNEFTDAIRRDDRMQWLGVRHEEGAALAAAGQAKVTGRLGVCAGTTGPGGTHLLAGLYEARHDHAPVLAITGDVPTSLAGIDYLQEANHVQAFRDACVYAASIPAADGAAAQIREAIATAYSERGVALLNIPQNVFGARTSGPVPSLSTLRPRPEIIPCDEDVDAAAALIGKARRITLLVGHGAAQANAQVLQLADRLNAPVVHTYRALSQFDFDDPRIVGGLGLIGSRAGYDAVRRCDLLIMIGSDYPYSEFLPRNVPVIQIDERAFAIGRRLPVTRPVVGSCRPALIALLDAVSAKRSKSFRNTTQRTWQSWRAMLDEKADPARSRERIHPQALARGVSDAAARDAVFVVDTGTVTLWAGNWLRPTGRQVVTGSFNNAAVGTALGMANGIQALDRERQVIVLCGDGGFGMLMQEFATAVQHQLPIKVFVFDNGTWGLVDLEMQEAAMPAFRRGVEMVNPDFAKFAQACGAQGFRASDPAELAGRIEQTLAVRGPAVLDVSVSPDEIPPMPEVQASQAVKFGIGKLRGWVSG